jgi:hypothetical protein
MKKIFCYVNTFHEFITSTHYFYWWWFLTVNAKGRKSHVLDDHVRTRDINSWWMSLGAMWG